MNGIDGHLLIGVETMSGDNPVRLLDTYKLVGIYFLGSFVPIEQFRVKTFTLPGYGAKGNLR